MTRLCLFLFSCFLFVSAVSTIGCAKKKDNKTAQVPYQNPPHNEKIYTDLGIYQIPYATPEEINTIITTDLLLENMTELDSQNYLWTLGQLRHNACQFGGPFTKDPHAKVGQLRLFKEAQMWKTGYQVIEETKEHLTQILPSHNSNPNFNNSSVDISTINTQVKRPLQTEYQITKSVSARNCNLNGNNFNCMYHNLSTEYNKPEARPRDEDAKKGFITGSFCTHTSKANSLDRQYFRADVTLNGLRIPVLVQITRGEELKIKCSGNKKQYVSIETLEVFSFRHVGLTTQDCNSGVPIVTKQTYLDMTTGQEIGHSVKKLVAGPLR